MTAQVSEYIEFDGERYNIIARTSSYIFNPESVGLIPRYRTTACQRGFWGGYVVAENILLLDSLYIFCEADYLDINGIYPEPPKTIEHICKEGKIYTTLSDMGHYKYSNLSYPLMDFTGKLLLGTNRVKGWGNSGGTDKYWKYKKLASLEFEKGVLVCVEDYSDYGKYVYSVVSENWDSSNGDFFMECDLQEKAELYNDHKPWWVKGVG